MEDYTRGGLHGYFKKDPKKLIVVLDRKYFCIYHEIRKKMRNIKQPFLASELTKEIRNILSYPARPETVYPFALKVLYRFFARRIVIADNPNTDRDLRSYFARRSGLEEWLSVKPSTPLRFNTDAFVLEARDSNEARIVQTFLAKITRDDGTADIVIAAANLGLEARKMAAKMKRVSDNIERCIERIRK